MGTRDSSIIYFRFEDLIQTLRWNSNRSSVHQAADKITIKVSPTFRKLRFWSGNPLRRCGRVLFQHLNPCSSTTIRLMPCSHIRERGRDTQSRFADQEILHTHCLTIKIGNYRTPISSLTCSARNPLLHRTYPK
jgi:hypothetical protein